MTYREKFMARLRRKFGEFADFYEQVAEDQTKWQPYQHREAIVRFGICCELLSELIEVLERDEKMEEPC